MGADGHRVDRFALVRRVQRRLLVIRCVGMAFVATTLFAALSDRPWPAVVVWMFGTLVIALLGYLTRLHLDETIRWAQHEQELDQWIEREGWHD